MGNHIIDIQGNGGRALCPLRKHTATFKTANCEEHIESFLVCQEEICAFCIGHEGRCAIKQIALLLTNNR